MVPATLARRGLAPADLPWRPAAAADPALALAFSHRGGYATLAAAAPPGAPAWARLEGGAPVRRRAHGVLYEVTPAQLAALSANEVGYRLAEVAVRPYGAAAAAAPLLAAAFLSSPWLRLRRPVAPPRRYRDLIVRGARERGLDADYVDWLEALPVVEPAALSAPEYSATPTEAAARAAAAAALALAAWLSARH
jgi:hypothetical protein